MTFPKQNGDHVIHLVENLDAAKSFPEAILFWHYERLCFLVQCLKPLVYFTLCEAKVNKWLIRVRKCINVIKSDSELPEYNCS